MLVRPYLFHGRKLQIAWRSWASKAQRQTPKGSSIRVLPWNTLPCSAQWLPFLVRAREAFSCRASECLLTCPEGLLLLSFWSTSVSSQGPTMQEPPGLVAKALALLQLLCDLRQVTSPHRALFSTLKEVRWGKEHGRVQRASMGLPSAKDQVLEIQEMTLTFYNFLQGGGRTSEWCAFLPACSSPITAVATVSRKRALCIFMNPIILYIQPGAACFSVKWCSIKTASLAVWVLSEVFTS